MIRDSSTIRGTSRGAFRTPGQPVLQLADGTLDEDPPAVREDGPPEDGGTPGGAGNTGGM